MDLQLLPFVTGNCPSGYTTSVDQSMIKNERIFGGMQNMSLDIDHVSQGGKAEVNQNVVNSVQHRAGGLLDVVGFGKN